MERLYKFKNEFYDTYDGLVDSIEEFEVNPTQANRNEVIRAMARFCKIKNLYMRALRDLILKGDNTKNLKFMKNVK